MTKRREILRIGANSALVAGLYACGGGGGSNANAQSTRPLRKRVTTRDGVSLSVIDVGDPAKPALLFVHGLSQSALSWAAQLTAANLLARFRLVAVDLRGHGLSQGALGALAEDATQLPLLPAARYATVLETETSQLWANDVNAVIQGLGLVSPLLVGWSYGCTVVLDYLRTQGGLGVASGVLMTGGTPVLLPPGTPGGGGGDMVFGVRVPAAVFKTADTNLLTSPPAASTYSDVVQGMAEFVELAYADAVPGRAPATRDDIVAATVFNLQLPPAARQSIVLRQFDFRSFIAALPTATRQRMRVISGSADAVIQTANTRSYFEAAGLPVTVLAGEGHMLFARNASAFNAQLLAFGTSLASTG